MKTPQPVLPYCICFPAISKQSVRPHLNTIKKALDRVCVVEESICNFSFLCAPKKMTLHDKVVNHSSHSVAKLQINWSLPPLTLTSTSIKKIVRVLPIVEYLDGFVKLLAEVFHVVFVFQSQNLNIGLLYKKSGIYTACSSITT